MSGQPPASAPFPAAGQPYPGPIEPAPQRGTILAVGIASTMLIAVLVAVGAFFAVGTYLDSLSTTACAQLSCGIGAGFILILIAAASFLLTALLGSTAAGLVLWARATWRRLAITLGVIAASQIVLTVGAMLLALALDNPNPTA